MQMGNTEGQCTEDEAMKVLLTPEAYRKLKEEEWRRKHQLPDDVKEDIDK